MARQFSAGSSQYLYGDVGVVPVGTTPLTMACFATVSDNSSFHSLINLGSSSSTHAFLLYIHTNGKLHVWISGSGCESSSTIGLGTRFHACGVWDTAERRCYVNGGNKTTLAGASVQTVDRVGVGAQLATSWSNMHTGLIWEVGIWNAALTDDEVLALAYGYSPGLIRPSALVGYWPLTGENPEPDRSRNGMALGISGATKADHGGPVIYRSRPKVSAVTVTAPIVATAAAVSLAIGVATATLVEGPRPVGIALAVPAATLETGPPSVAIAVAVPAATLVEGPVPVPIALAVPTHTLYQGAFTIPIAVGVPAVGAGQIVAATPVSIAIQVPTPILIQRPPITVSIAGVDQRVRFDGITLTEALNHEADSAFFRVEGFRPEAAQPVYITLGDSLIFGGSIARVVQVHEGDRADLLAYDVDAQDHGRLIDRRLINEQYLTTAADVIAKDIITRYTSGFTTVHVVTGLPVIDEIQFTDEKVSDALTRIAQRVGAYWYVDASRDVHLFLTEADETPDPITDADPGLAAPDITVDADVTQVRTRVIVEGGGSTTTAEVAAGSTSIPLEDGVWYSATGGLVKVGTLRLTYTGRLAGGAGTTLRSLDAPTATPSASLITGGGAVEGSVSYRVSFKNSAGETLAGPVSNTVTAYAFGTNVGGTSAPSLAYASGIGRLVGSYRYRVTAVTAIGETPFISPLAVSAVITPAAVATPSGPSVSLASGVGVLVGAFGYKVTFVTARGETLPSTAGSRTASVFSPPGTPSVSVVASTWGHIKPGTYRYALAYVTPYGQTTLGSVSDVTMGTWTPGATSYNSASAAGGGDVEVDTYQWYTAFVDADGGVSNLGSWSGASISVTTGPRTVTVNIPLGPAGTVARRIYRQRTITNPGNYFYVGEVQDNLATTFTDNTRHGSAEFTGGTMGGRFSVAATSNQAPDVLTKRVYRSKRNTTSPLYLVGELPGSGGTWVDDVPDSALTVLSPQANTAGGQRHTITIPTGPSGTLARRLYRTAPGGITYNLLAEIQDNTTGSYTDNLLEASGAGPPLVSTAGGQDIVVSVPAAPGGMTGVVALRAYRTKNGTNDYFFVGQVAGSGGGSFTDSKLDDELGEPPPTVNEAGGDSVQVTLPIGPSGITSRVLYRRDSAGVYRFVLEVANNSDTAVLDTLSERDLGDPVPLTGGIGALPGATEVLVESAAAIPSEGWVYIGNQLVRFTGRSSSPAKITGVPASGVGALATALRVGADVVVASMITGIPASGSGSIAHTIKQGEPVNVLVERNDAAAQAALAAIEGGDGIHEHKIADGRLSIQGATARADAELALFASPIVTVAYRTRDQKTRVGRSISINLGAPTNLVGTFKIQRVSRTDLGYRTAAPLCAVTASSVKFSIEDVLRHIVLRST